MPMKKILPIVLIGVVLVLGYLIATGTSKEPSQEPVNVSGTQREVSDGSYEIVASESTVGWAGKKPLIEGYINDGSIAVSAGTIAVANKSATGSFTIDMNSLLVSHTLAKPGKESMLEEHLKSDRWFDVSTYPTASFEITRVTEREDSSTSFTYDVTGALTMKGQAHEISFPAMIYLDETGRLHAQAETEINRTLWGITSGSASFFDGLADNVIDDMVALSFHVVAVPK